MASEQKGLSWNSTLVNLRSGHFSPGWMLVSGFAAWLIARLSIPFIWFTGEFQPAGILLLLGYILAFVIGTFLVPKWITSGLVPVKGIQGSNDQRAIRFTSAVLIALSYLFVSLRFYDIVANRGLFAFASVQAARLADNTEIIGRTTGGLGLISGMGYPIAIPMMMFAVLFRDSLKKWHYYASIGAFIYYSIFVVVSGNRFILLGPLFLVFTSVVLTQKVLKITIRGAVIACTIFLACFTFITLGTRERDRLFGTKSAIETLAVMPARSNYGTTPEFLVWMQEQPEIVQEGILGWVNLMWYECHGLYEFQNTMDYQNPNVRTYGVAQFSVAFYFFRVMGLTTLDDSTWIREVKNPGFYTSFFWPVYVDFGIPGGAIFMVLVGFLSGFFWEGVKKRNLSSLLLYPFFASLIFNFSTNNLIMNGLGVVISANIVFAVILCGFIRNRAARLKEAPTALTR